MRVMRDKHVMCNMLDTGAGSLTVLSHTATRALAAVPTAVPTPSLPIYRGFHVVTAPRHILCDGTKGF